MEILQKTIEQIRKQYGLAGGILVAVKDGKVVLKECFGMADAEQNKPVDSKTLFQIASCSKAFTTMVAGQLCDEGKMTWDTPVKQLMPDFQMVDKYAEEHVTPRDMGCHRTGLCRHDVMRTFVREDRADLVRRIAYFPPAFGFREKYSYQNQMYVALGYLCERLTGKTWEELLKERIGEPLGICTSAASTPSRTKTPPCLTDRRTARSTACRRWSARPATPAAACTPTLTAWNGGF